MRVWMTSGVAAARDRRRRFGSTGLVWALATFAAAGALDAAPADARSATDVANFNIPAQDLDGAVLAFGRIAGVRVFNDSEKLKGRRGAAVTGAMTVEEALGRLLAGTGLHYAFTDRDAVRIFELMPTAASTESAVELEEINVRGAGGGSGETATGPVRGYVAKRSATATKSDTPIIEIPRAISVVTADEVRARGGAQNINDALAYTPGFFTTATNDSRSNSTMRLRGFSLYESLYLDGLALPIGSNRAQPQIEPYGLERVEVLKGPASVLYGQGEPGGVVNMVSKRPVFDDPIREVRAQTGSFDRYQAAFDLSDTFGSDGDFAYRLTGLGQNSDTQVDHTKDNRFFIAPSVTWRPDDQTSLTILTHYRNAKGGDFTNQVPRGIANQLPRSTFVGEPGFDRNDMEQFAVGYEFNHKFNDAFQVFSNARFIRTTTGYRALYEADPTGNPDKPGEYYRSIYVIDETIRGLTLDNRAQFDFDVGPFASKLVVGVDHRRQKVTNRDGFYFQAGPIIDFFNPRDGTPVEGAVFNTSNDRRLEQVGVYAQEQIKFDRFVLSFGGRKDWAKSSVVSHTIGDPSNRIKFDATDFTGNVGLVYLFDNGLAPFASYSTSFKPQADTNADGTPFKPTTGQQYEAGVKFQPPGFNLFMQASVFELTKQNVLTDDPTQADPAFRKQTGEIRMRGFEFETKASLQGFDLTAAYAHLDPVITKSGDGNKGLKPTEAPKHQASLWANYSFLSGPLTGLNVGGGARYLGAFYGDDFEKIRLKPVTFFDLAAGYDFGALNPGLSRLRLDLNVINVADKKHLDSCDDYGCLFARRRTALATLSYKW